MIHLQLMYPNPYKSKVLLCSLAKVGINPEVREIMMGWSQNRNGIKLDGAVDSRGYNDNLCRGYKQGRELIVRKTHYKLQGIQSNLFKHLTPNCASQKMLHFCTMRNKRSQVQIPLQLIFASLWNLSFPLPCFKYENFGSKSKMSLRSSCHWREFLVKALSF